MADSPDIIKRIYLAVASLNATMNAKFINFFDRTTLDAIILAPGSARYVVTTGTLACGEWRDGDDVRLVCLTETSESLFWEYVAERLELKERTKMPASGTSIMELSSHAFSKALDGGASQLSEFATLSRKDQVWRPSQTFYFIHPTDHIFLIRPAANSTSITAFSPLTSIRFKTSHSK